MFFLATVSHTPVNSVGVGFFIFVGLFVVAVCCRFLCVAALLITGLQKYGRLANDAILAVLSNAGLAVGILVALSAGGQRRFDFESYLFGNFLSVTGVDVILIAAFSAVAIIGIAVFWRRLLIITFNADRLENLPVFKIEMLFAALLAVVIVCAIKVLGLLLTVSILILPASAAAGANSIKAMVFRAIAFGVFAVIVGISAAFMLNIPPGPAIVLAAIVSLVGKIIVQSLRKN